MKRVCKAGSPVAVIDIAAPDDPELASSCNRYERMRDPSHTAALRREELEGLFREAGLAVESTETLDVPVDFNRWIALTGTDETVERTIRGELAGGPATGMRPVRREGALFFHHTYLKVIGRRR